MIVAFFAAVALVLVRASGDRRSPSEERRTRLQDAIEEHGTPEDDPSETEEGDDGEVRAPDEPEEAWELLSEPVTDRDRADGEERR